MTVIFEENIGGRIQRWHRHTGDRGQPQITVETVQDVEPVFEEAKRLSNDKGDFRFLGTIPATVIDEVSKINAKRWGISVADAFREIIGNKTSRAHAVWKLLLKDSEYRKFQRS